MLPTYCIAITDADWLWVGSIR